MSDEEFEDFSDDLEGVVPELLADDTYLCEITEATRNTSKKDGRQWANIEWTVLEGPYAEETFSEVYRVATKEEYEAADPKERKDIREARQKRRDRLVSLGVSQDELNTVKLSDILGIKAYVTVRVRPRTKGTGYNVWVDNVEVATSVTQSLSWDV